MRSPKAITTWCCTWATSSRCAITPASSMGRPVAASSLVPGRGVAGVYCVATLPEARGRGLGTALTVLPLLEAREMGFHTGVLQSSDMGYPIYQKIGFRTTCLIDHYYKALG